MQQFSKEEIFSEKFAEPRQSPQLIYARLLDEVGHSRHARNAEHVES